MLSSCWDMQIDRKQPTQYSQHELNTSFIAISCMWFFTEPESVSESKAGLLSKKIKNWKWGVSTSMRDLIIAIKYSMINRICFSRSIGCKA